jgi:hypothetical protein
MKVGDIVLYKGSPWKVLSHSQNFHTCQLGKLSGDKVEIADDLVAPELQVLCNPAETWPFVAAPVHPKAGPLVGVNRGAIGLGPLIDWAPSDFLRPGGSIFFNPALQLRVGEVLVGVHKTGTRSRIAITNAFGTLSRRRHRIDNPAKVKGPPSSYERLMGRDIFDED